MTLDLCRALCACGCGFEIDALDAPMGAHVPASSRAGAGAHHERPARAVHEDEAIAPATEATPGRGDTPAVRGSTPPAPAAYASDRTPRR